MNNNSENIKEWDKPLFETSFKETGNWHAKESREKVGEIIYTLYEGLQNVYESIGGFYDEADYQKALEKNRFILLFPPVSPFSSNSKFILLLFSIEIILSQLASLNCID